MTNSEIVKLFSSINCARLGEGYAPHKPILILILLDRILNGYANHFPFAELDYDLKRLLEKYGSNNASNTRVRSKLRNGIARVLFVMQGNAMVLIHGFIKKDQKISKADLDLAKDRAQQLRSRL